MEVANLIVRAFYLWLLRLIHSVLTSFQKIIISFQAKISKIITFASLSALAAWIASYSKHFLCAEELSSKVIFLITLRSSGCWDR